MNFTTLRVNDLGRQRLALWLESTALRLIRKPRSAPDRSTAWRIRQPLEMQGRIYPKGAVLILSNDRIMVEKDG